MIITNEILDNKPLKNIKKFKDTTCLVNLVKTEDSIGVVCYFFDNLKCWHPFYAVKEIKTKFKAKTYADLIVNLPKLDTNNISDVKGKFYNTFDSPIEINLKPLDSIYSIIEWEKFNTFERKTYYLITDVQELERTFNSNILPCEIIDFNNINQNFKNYPVDDSLKFLVENILK